MVIKRGGKQRVDSQGKCWQRRLSQLAVCACTCVWVQAIAEAHVARWGAAGHVAIEASVRAPLWRGVV